MQSVFFHLTWLEAEVEYSTSNNQQPDSSRIPVLMAFSVNGALHDTKSWKQWCTKSLATENIWPKQQKKKKKLYIFVIVTPSSGVLGG